MARSSWWMTLALLPLLAAAGFAFHDPFHREDTGPNMSVSHGLVFEPARFVQFNLSVHNHQDNAENVVLTLELPDLGPFPDPEGDGGWRIAQDEDGACSFAGEEQFRCEWDHFPTHMERTVVIVGDAACLCGTFDLLYQVTADGEVDERDNSQLIRLDWPCDTPQGAMGTTVEARATAAGAEISIEVRNVDWWPPLFGVEVWSDLPLLDGGWTIRDHHADDVSWSQCSVDFAEDLFCGASPIWGMGTMRVVLEATPADACGDHPFQVVVTSDSAAPRHLDRVLSLRPCPDLGPASLDGSVEPFQREDGIAGAELAITNAGLSPATNVRVTATFSDLARPWSFELAERDERVCVAEEINVLECVLPRLLPGETWTATGWTNVEGWCGGSAGAELDATWDNQAGDALAVASGLGLPPCEPGKAADAAIFAHPENGEDWVIITFDVVAVGDGASEEVRFRTNLPHMGGARWLVHGDDREYCTLTFHELNCDFGQLPAGAARQVWVKAWQHHDDCAFDVVIAHLTAAGDETPGGNNQAEATIVPPWKLHEERFGHRGP